MDLPEANSSGVTIPKVNVGMDALMGGDADLPSEGVTEDKHVMCLCRVGMRSEVASQILKMQGYKTANIFGGIMEL